MKKCVLGSAIAVAGCLGFMAVVLGIAALTAFPVMWIWNAVVPASWSHLTWLTAFGIMVILSLFVGQVIEGRGR